MKKAFLIDDEPLIQQAIKNLNARNNLNIEVIGEPKNEIEALERIERDRPDLIFLDIHMPLMDGFGLLKKLNEKNNFVKTIILMAYRDFDYASEAMKYGAFGYIVKPIDEVELIDIVEKVCLKIDEERKIEIVKQQLNNMLRANFMERLVEGYDLKTLLKEKENPIPDIRNENCQVIIVRTALTMHEVEPLQQLLGTSYMFEYKGDIVVVYNHQANCLVHEIQIALMDILTNFQSQISKEFVCSFGVSSPYATLLNLRRAYQEAMAAIFYQNTSINPNVYFLHNNFDHLYHQDLKISQGLYLQFAEKLLLGMNEEALGLIRQFKEVLADAILIDLDLVYHYYFEFVLQLKLVNAKMNIQEQHKSWITRLKLSDLQSYRTLESLSLFFEQLIFEFISQSQAEETNRMIQKIKQYIQENFAKEISLHTLAEHLYVSKNYVSMIFKKKTGINYLEYLTHVRMEQAKMKLETTEMGINQIAHEIGYKNASYFGKLFKQEVGVTPAEYRQRIIKNF